MASGDSVYVAWWDARSSIIPDPFTLLYFGQIYFNRSQDGGATWLQSNVQLSREPGHVFAGVSYFGGLDIAADGQSVYVTWDESRPSEDGIFFNRSTDGGETWLPQDIPLRLSHDGAHPQIAASGDSVYMTWRSSLLGGNEIYFNRSLDRGVTWLPAAIPLDSELTSGSSGSPKIVALGKTVYVTWWSFRNALAADIYFNRSLDGGLTWLSSEIRLDSDSPREGHSAFPKIATSGDSVYVTWRDKRNDLPNIYFNRSLDRGLTWLPSDIRLDTDLPVAGNAIDPQIATSGESVYVTWMKQSNGFLDIYFNRSLDRGTTWMTTDIRLDSDLPGAGNSNNPQIAASGDSVFVTWWDDRNGDPSLETDIYFNRSSDGGLTWLPSDVRMKADLPEANKPFDPQIAASGESVYITWADSSGAYFNIPFGAQPFGEGSAGSGDLTPRLHGTDSLTLGGTFTLSITNGVGGAFGLLALGGPNSKTAIPIAGGNLLINPIDRILPLKLEGPLGAPGAGSLRINCPIPDEPALLGFNINMQALFIDPGAPGSIAWTNGVEAWIL
ncbi:MAG: hypothetical protein ACYTG5_20675 [Planctomycetota bacterium]